MKFVEKITIKELSKMSEKMFGKLVKAVVDIEKGLLVVDAQMHADIEREMLSQGSKQVNLWGINLYPSVDLFDKGFIEFDSMINLRPLNNNYTRSVDDSKIQEKIKKIVYEKVTN